MERLPFPYENDPGRFEEGPDGSSMHLRSEPGPAWTAHGGGAEAHMAGHGGGGGGGGGFPGHHGPPPGTGGGEGHGGSGPGFFPFFFPWWGFSSFYANHTCKSCGEQVPNVAKFCPWCRAPQGGPNATAAPCPECAGSTVAGAPYCPHCGTKVPSTECSECHATLDPRAKFCSACGKAVQR